MSIHTVHRNDPSSSSNNLISCCGWTYRVDWLKNINDDLTSFDMELLEASDATQNRPFWRMLASHRTTHP